MRLGAPLGADLHERRQSLGLTAENVARCLDTTPEIVALIEAGKDADASQVWRLSALLALAHDQRQAEPHPLPLSLAMGSLLRFERVRQQLTLKVVGQRIGRPARWVGDVERARENPDFLAIDTLARDGLTVPSRQLVQAAEYAIRALATRPLDQVFSADDAGA
jgi:transcriptional regulator with XRE-family HTH domain